MWVHTGSKPEECKKLSSIKKSGLNGMKKSSSRRFQKISEEHRLHQWNSLKVVIRSYFHGQRKWNTTGLPRQNSILVTLGSRVRDSRVRPRLSVDTKTKKEIYKLKTLRINENCGPLRERLSRKILYKDLLILDLGLKLWDLNLNNDESSSYFNLCKELGGY